MKEYIDKDLVIQKLKLRLITTKLCEDSVYKKGQIDARTENIEVVKYIPAADVEPVRHGKWLDECSYDAHYQPIYRCSECNKTVADYYISEHKYCLHCGAKMDGGKSND